MSIVEQPTCRYYKLSLYQFKNTFCTVKRQHVSLCFVPKLTVGHQCITSGLLFTFCCISSFSLLFPRWSQWSGEKEASLSAPGEVIRGCPAGETSRRPADGGRTGLTGPLLAGQGGAFKWERATAGKNLGERSTHQEEARNSQKEKKQCHQCPDNYKHYLLSYDITFAFCFIWRKMY